MPSIAQDITHYAGDSATIVIGPILDENGAPVDLNGATARWKLAKAATSVGTDVYVSKSTEATQVAEDGTTEPQMEFVRVTTDSWELRVYLLPADTETVSTTFKPQPGSLYHEAEVVDADDKVSTVCLGKFVLKPTVVRNA